MIVQCNTYRGEKQTPTGPIGTITLTKALRGKCAQCENSLALEARAANREVRLSENRRAGGSASKSPTAV